MAYNWQKYTEKNNNFWIAVLFMFPYIIFVLFTGPPPIPSEPVVPPEPAYVSKVHYGRKVLYDDLF